MPITEGGSSTFLDQELVASLFAIENGISSSVNLSLPGKYAVLMTAVRALRLSDQKTFKLPYLGFQEFTVTHDDLIRATVEAQIHINGLFQLLVLNREGKLVANNLVSFSPISPAQSERVRNFTIRTDDNGEITMAGKPGDYRIILPEGQGERIQVTPM
ncbi:MAG: hypothetical protein ACRD18_08240 [Terriglobia bacterium]